MATECLQHQSSSARWGHSEVLPRWRSSDLGPDVRAPAVRHVGGSRSTREADVKLNRLRGRSKSAIWGLHLTGPTATLGAGAVLRHSMLCSPVPRSAQVETPVARLRARADPPARLSGEPAPDPASGEVSGVAAADQTARTSASRLTAYSSPQQTAASHAADVCAVTSCVPSSRPAALWAVPGRGRGRRRATRPSRSA
jgi:hypothetical protein